MKKIVISGSSKLQEELITWKKYFEQKGYEVIDYPKQVSKENLKDIYKIPIVKEFFKDYISQYYPIIGPRDILRKEDTKSDLILVYRKK